MAQIPRGENLGFRVPEAQRAAQVPAGGQAAREVATAAGTALERMELETRRAEAERRQEEKEAAREAELARKRADQAKANEVMLAAGDELQLLHDDLAEGVKAGKVPKGEADAEWARRSAEHLSAAIETVPQEHREIVQPRLQHRASVLARGVRKAVAARDQSDTLASLEKTLESTQRMYMKDPVQAQAITDKTLEELGPAAGLTPKQIHDTSQRWKESTRFNLGNALVTAARRDNKALDAVAQRLAGPEFADMDPQRKTTLLAQVEGFRVANAQQAELAARRAEAAADRQLRQAEAEFTAASSLVNSGKVLSDEYIQRLTARTAGTPFAAAVPELLKQAPAKTSFGSQPVAVMDATIQGLRAQLNQRGTDPKIEKQLQELEQIRDAARREYKEDPLPAALERGILPQIAPLDVSSMASVRAGLAARVEQAQLVATRVGAPVSPLLRTEAEQVSKLIAALPVDQRSTAIAELAQAAGPQIASAIGRQIAPKDKALGIALGMAGDRTTAGRYTSELVLRGAQAVKDRSINLENQSVTGIRSQVAGEIGDAVSGEARETLVEAAILTYYGLQSEGSASVGQAVRLATGGVVERGGRKVLLPYGMPEADFEKKLRALTPEALKVPEVYIDGKPMPAADFVKVLPDAALVTVGNGRYNVRAGRSLATDKAGRPVVVEVR